MAHGRRRSRGARRRSAGEVTARLEAAVASAAAGRPPSTPLVEALAEVSLEGTAAGREGRGRPGRSRPRRRCSSPRCRAHGSAAGSRPTCTGRSSARTAGPPRACWCGRSRPNRSATMAPCPCGGASSSTPSAPTGSRPRATPPGRCPGRRGAPRPARPTSPACRPWGWPSSRSPTLRRLPRLPKLGPAPGEPAWPSGDRPRADASVLRKVTSLLAKAESTTFPDEAEALTAKAQQLMTRHAIDRAQLDAGRGDEPVAGGRRLPIDDPYANARYLLLAAVAAANRCRAVLTKQWGFSTVFGDEDDLDTVELLFTSLLVQATRAMVLEPPIAAGNGGRTRLVPPRVPRRVRRPHRRAPGRGDRGRHGRRRPPRHRHRARLRGAPRRSRSCARRGVPRDPGDAGVGARPGRVAGGCPRRRPGAAGRRAAGPGRRSTEPAVTGGRRVGEVAR